MNNWGKCITCHDDDNDIAAAVVVVVVMMMAAAVLRVGTTQHIMEGRIK